MTKKTRPVTVSTDLISKDFTKKDWQDVENEKKYYELVVKLRELRKEIGLTQEELALKADMPRETIVRVESGKRNTTLETLMNIAQAMGRDLKVSLH